MAKAIELNALDDMEPAATQPATQATATATQEPPQTPETEPEGNFLESMDFEGPILFDIETGPLPDHDLAELFEFDETKVKGYELVGEEFDPSTVKYGNTKDQGKRTEKLEAARAKFEADKKEAEARFATAEQDAFAAFRDRAALDARTCEVLAIAYMDSASGEKILDDGDGHEGQLLTTFWELYAFCRTQQIAIVGFNSNSFDVPVLARRAMYHRISLPSFRNGRYLDPTFVDLRDAWGCGEFNPKGNLDSLSTFFGGPRKNGDGAHFYKLWHGTEAERKQAVEYALNDIDMTYEVAKGLQVI